MADALNIPTSGTSAPVILNTPGSSQAPVAPVQQNGQADAGLGGVDPSKLSPELQQLYRSMQGDYTRKTTELSEKEKQWGDRERQWDSERQNYRRMEQQFQDLNRRVQNYAEQERRWNEWTPFLQAAAQPGMMERLLAVMQGRATGAAGPGASGEATVARLIEGLKDDDFVDGATLQRGLGQLKAMMQQEIMQSARGEMENYARQAVKAVADWVQNYQTLADQMMNLRLMHEFNLRPSQDRRFDPQRVVETARQRGITDLDLAYQIAYGQDDAMRAVQMAQNVASAERERIEKDAYDRATKEAELRFRNQQAGLVSGDGVMLPKFQATRPSTYGEIERDLAERLSAIGMSRR